MAAGQQDALMRWVETQACTFDLGRGKAADLAGAAGRREAARLGPLCVRVFQIHWQGPRGVDTVYDNCTATTALAFCVSATARDPRPF